MALPSVPNLVVLEGVDGAGKSVLFQALSRYYEQLFSNQLLYIDAFPGSHAGTLGEWVRRFHRNRVTRAPSKQRVAPPALQLMHVAAHVDAIVQRIEPTLRRNGNVLLDRYWWTTYAYARLDLTPEQALAIVAPERIFWQPLPKPTIVYVSRKHSLKPHQIDEQTHRQLDGYYREILTAQRAEGITVHELSNEGTLDEAWLKLLGLLNLPEIPYADVAETM